MASIKTRIGTVTGETATRSVLLDVPENEVLYTRQWIADRWAFVDGIY